MNLITHCRTCHHHLNLTEDGAYCPICDKEITITKIIYKTGIEEPNVLGSGSCFYKVYETQNEEKAFEMFGKDRRDFLYRTVYTSDGDMIGSAWDILSKQWL